MRTGTSPVVAGQRRAPGCRTESTASCDWLECRDQLYRGGWQADDKGVQMSPPSPPLPETADPSGDEEVTPFEGLTEDDADGFPQPVALGEFEDDDPGADPGEELPGEEGESP
jgi:hypothetical protein